MSACPLQGRGLGALAPALPLSGSPPTSFPTALTLAAETALALAERFFSISTVLLPL